MSLDRLLGTWATSMTHVAIAEPVLGEQRCERVLDGAFVMMRSRHDHPEVPDALVLMDESSQHSFDVRGVMRVFDLFVTESGWSVIRRDSNFWQRATVTFVGPDAMEGIGENSHDQGATWEHDFTMSATRIE